MQQFEATDYPHQLLPTIAKSGDDVEEFLATLTAGLPRINTTPGHALLDIGINDRAAMPPAAEWQADFAAILDALRAKWPEIQVWVMYPWARGADAQAATLHSWIDTVISTRSDWVHVAGDEAVWMKGSDDGATLTDDGVHPNEAGYEVMATVWLTGMGF